MKKILTAALILMASLAQSEVMIKEIMADNGGKYPNAAGEAMDWLELYNPSSSSVDLTGWRITDTVEDKWSKWKEIPAGTTVPAQGYLLLWGHNKDFPTPEDAKGFCGVTNGEVHVKLGLSSKGETITLAASEADYDAKAFADQVTFGAQFADVSYGRNPNDTAKWLFFTNATPCAANGNDGLEKYPPEEEPGPGVDEDVDGLREGEFVVVLDVRRPVAGKAMKATVTGERTGNVSFAWFVREPMGAYGDVACEGREYTPTTADYEHWIRVTATDEGGSAVSAEFYFSKLPIVYINTDDGKAVTSKAEYKGATIRIQGNDLYDQQYEGATEIKGRGNSSWEFPKKPYKLKLDKKTDLFGFGKNKHWVLISNWLDVCGMRNWTASTLAKELGVIGMDMTWVQVVLNGSYNGTYMLCEHIRVGEDRIDVFDWSDTIESDGHNEEDLSWLDMEGDVDFSGGYIFELDNRYDEVSKFTVANGLKVMFNEPEFACTSLKMMAYAQELWSNFEFACCAEDGYAADGRHYSHIADIDSMAMFWLVNEVMANNDSICFSRYAHKDRGGLLTFGPVWDFDVATDSMMVNKTCNPETWTACQYNSSQNLFLEWSDDPLFDLKLLEAYWGKVRPWMIELLEGGIYDARIEFQREAGAMNDIRWDRVNEYDTPIDSQHPRSFNGEFGDAAVVKDFLLRRIAWMDDQFSSVDCLLRSVYTKYSASPYVKDDQTLVLRLDNGKDVVGVDAETDFVLDREAEAPQIRVAVSNGAIVKLHAYVNGLKCGIYDVADGRCKFTVSADKMVAERGHRDMVSLIAKDVDGKTIARNYLTILNPPIQAVTVTEIMADNGGSLLTADGKAEDWIELYNPGATDADISGWLLCDSTTKKWSKWEELPKGTIVPAGGYLIVWADDFTGWTNGEVHVNLGFSSKGEEVALAIAAGEIVDSFAFGPQHTDISFGRDPSDLEKLVYFRTPTPGAANGDAGCESLVFTINFDSNGGTPVASVTNDYDAAISAPDAPVRTGYTFEGWYEAGAADPFVFSTMPARDVALAARWTANVYSIVYELNGGANAAGNPATYTIEDAITLAAPTRSGYVFKGWTPDGGVIAKGSTGGLVFTANWEEIVEPPPKVVDEAETHVDVEKGEVASFKTAAAVYDGFLFDGEKVVGSVQVKVARGKEDKSGVFSAKVTATVLLAGEAKKLSFRGGIADERGTVTEMKDKKNHKLAVTVGVKGLGGTFDGKYRIDGARNVFIGKSVADKSASEKAMERYRDTYNVAFGGGTLSVTVGKKGKVKIAGSVMGNMVSATSQLVVGRDGAVVPVVIVKNVNVTFCLWVMADGTVEVRGVEGAIADRPSALKAGAKFRVEGAAGVRSLPGLYGEYLPNGVDVAANGTKWTVAGGAKAGKVVFAKGGMAIDQSKLGANPSGLKLTYKMKDGTFKGSFKAYDLGNNGRFKAYTVRVMGVMIGTKGYGTATIRKPVCTFSVRIE